LRFSEKAFRHPPILFCDSRRVYEASLRQRGLRFDIHIGGFDQMGRVTLLASNTVELVFRFIEKRLIVTRNMTCQAAPGIFCRFPMKAEDELLSGSGFLVVSTRILDRLNVRLAWAVTAFASSAMLSALGCRFGMSGLRKHVRMDWMASRAGFSAGVIVTLSFRRGSPYDR
jgi:hypothetical protein